MNRKLIYVSLIFLLLATSPNMNTTAQDDADGQWELLTDDNPISPQPRHENGFVQHDGLFYLIGGRGMFPLEIYDPVNDEWSEGAPPPIEMHHIQPFVYQNEIWVVHAYTGRCCSSEMGAENIYIYSPQRDAWRLGPAIPSERRRGAAGVVLHEELIYVVGGLEGGHGPPNATAVTYFDRYDPATDTWTPLPDMPRARDHFSAVIVDNQLYAIGGRDTTNTIWEDTIAEIDMYDFDSDTWETLNEASNLPTLRAGAAYAVMGSEIIVAGGEDAERAYRTVEAFDTETQTWRELPTMLLSRHGTQFAICNNALYIAAGARGRGGGPELNSLERFFTGDNAPPCTSANN